MKLNKLKDFLNRARDAIKRKSKELEDMQLDLNIDRTLNDEEDLLLLDIKNELMGQEQKNIKELRKICDKYENKLEEIEDEIK